MKRPTETKALIPALMVVASALNAESVLRCYGPGKGGGEEGGEGEGVSLTTPTCDKGVIWMGECEQDCLVPGIASSGSQHECKYNMYHNRCYNIICAP